jgi:hypothetical protein
MSLFATERTTAHPLRRLLLTAGTLLAVAVLPLAGCDSNGSPGVGDGDGDDDSDDDSEMTELEAPDDLEATAQDDGTVQLSWSGVDAADAYNVYRSTSSIDNADGSPLANEVSGTAYTDESATPDTTYNYRVTSLDGDGTESDLSENAEITTPLSTPGNGGGTDSWTEVRTSTDNDINDVALTAEGAYAVADGGILLKRTDSTWVTVIGDGPASNSRTLLSIDATDDGERLWFVGASGAIGEYDVTTGSLVEDHTGPNDNTNNFQSVSVTGPSGSANVYVGDDSGTVIHSADNGGSWTESTFASGVVKIDMYDAQSGHLADGNNGVYETAQGWTSNNKIGIADAGNTFFGVDSDASDDVWVSTASGTVYRWNGSNWTPTSVGMNDLRDIEVAADDQNGYVVGASAVVFGYDGSSWSAQEAPGTSNLNAVVLGTDTTPPIAVGDGGTVIER